MPTPLRPPVFHILLALSSGPMHGLGIADEVESASAGSVELGPGTLYRSLFEMADAGLIRSTKAESGADPRRKYYRLSAAGRVALTTEAERLQQLVSAAKARNILPDRA
jgi:DNA-binding PadR family transcriptional regulator